jgi:hypothetical protein
LQSAAQIDLAHGLLRRTTPLLESGRSLQNPETTSDTDERAEAQISRDIQGSTPGMMVLEETSGGVVDQSGAAGPVCNQYQTLREVGNQLGGGEGVPEQFARGRPEPSVPNLNGADQSGSSRSTTTDGPETTEQLLQRSRYSIPRAADTNQITGVQDLQSTVQIQESSASSPQVVADQSTSPVKKRARVDRGKRAKAPVRRVLRSEDKKGKNKSN